MLDKPALRQRMKMVRELVDNHLMRSVELWAAVAELEEYHAAATVMAFVGVKGEPDTDPLFARLEAAGKTLVLPRMVADPAGGQCIEPAVVGAGLVPARFGLREPSGPVVDLAQIDLVITPGLAFTPAGDRMGYGGGFYDRFLPTVRAAAVGVCFTEQLVDELPTTPTDVRVQRVIAA